ncbi:hypothetical protein [Lonepinella sp. BR2930]|uniref:hypothetical protein n=1 Tax=Lonepinella sp. BR2930 TaxID=3434554 RepID=UPI003F6DFB7F
MIFDIEKALAGHPVKLRNGRKAFITKRVTGKLNSDNYLLGYSLTKRHTPINLSWDIDGINIYYKQPFFRECITMFDIICMWDTPDIPEILHYEIEDEKQWIEKLSALAQKEPKDSPLYRERLEQITESQSYIKKLETCQKILEKPYERNKNQPFGL